MDPYTYNGRSFDTDLLILRSLFALNPDTNLPISTNYVLTTDGIGGLVWQNPLDNLSSAGTGIGYLPSTLFLLTSNLSTVSSMTSSLQIGLSTLSTTLGLFVGSGIYTFQVNSTIEGLATYGYVSTTQLTSTVEGLGTAGFVSSTQLLSTVAWFQDPSRYISTGNLVSTTAAFIANPTLLSTVAGLGSAGYISSQTFYSTLNSISTLNTSSLQSTVTGLGSAGYVSSLTLYSTFNSISTLNANNLQSTVIGLGSIGYISSAALLSTTAWILNPSQYISTGNLISTTIGLSTNLQTAFYIDRAGSLIINGGTIVISSASNVAFLSSFICSSITYEGNQGDIQGVVYPNVSAGPNMFFSSATLRFDQFSSYITSNASVVLDIYPTFVFAPLNTGATNFFVTPMSTLLAYGNTYLAAQTSSWIYANDKTATYGNLFQQPMKILIPGSALYNKYSSNYVLCHNLPSSLTSNFTPGFVNCNISMYFGSTTSLFLTVQNIYV